MRNVDRSWSNEDINVQVSHHSGWITLCQTLKLLQPNPQGMNFGDLKRCYSIASYGSEFVTALQVIHKVQTIFMFQGAPRGALDYEKAMSRINDGMAAIPEAVGALGSADKYRGLWTRRQSLCGERMVSSLEGSFPSA